MVCLASTNYRTNEWSYRSRCIEFTGQLSSLFFSFEQIISHIPSLSLFSYFQSLSIPSYTPKYQVLLGISQFCFDFGQVFCHLSCLRRRLVNCICLLFCFPIMAGKNLTSPYKKQRKCKPFFGRQGHEKSSSECTVYNLMRRDWHCCYGVLFTNMSQENC